MELQSPTIATLTGALVKAQAKIGHALKDAQNPHFKNSYATLESVIDATRLALASENIVIWQPNAFDESGRAVVVTQLSHSSGEWIRSYTPIFNEKGTAQGFGSGVSYARRYALAAMCNIAQTDDDGNEASGNDPNGGGQQSPQKPSGPAPAPASSKAADYLIGFGKKYKGLTIKKACDQFGLPELQNYANWMLEEADKTKKPLSQTGQSFISALEQYTKDVKASGDWQDDSWNQL